MRRKSKGRTTSYGRSGAEKRGQHFFISALFSPLCLPFFRLYRNFAAIRRTNTVLP
ncbi:hypothetical protein GCWU000325_01086 [Alloprevotella tannerae ATCC 51259]|uniref:Uncharacterized protein n=1 Tax=Alloprevotella tannerae ATCC 51259 TaxID=626522 RepID=C9LFU8_9BACT|nr:hypothetical protein GCWU000325_01086 [Alloprevotella tannerae ATCC 51259]